MPADLHSSCGAGLSALPTGVLEGAIIGVSVLVTPHEWGPASRGGPEVTLAMFDLPRSDKLPGY